MKAFFLKVLAYFKQPTSVAGVSAIAGTLSALATHQLSVGQALPVLAGGIVAVMMPDNSAAKQAAVTLVTAIETPVAAPVPPGK